MKQQSLNSWDDFQSELAALDKIRAELSQDRTVFVSHLLFRGQADSSWTLQTSLERASGQDEFELSNYHRIISSAKSEIEAFTGRTWDIPGSSDYAYRTKGAHLIIPQTVYEYMAHLRHHGFPSPLLDWTTSPYVAAYFAFADGNSESGSAAIYAYLEDSGRGKSGWVNDPQITEMGPYVRTHTRHFLQRCRYTICAQPVGEISAQSDVESPWVYVPHESTFQRNQEDQDILWKLTIPRSERIAVLRYLDRHNITAFSLFASEDRLMESLAIRAFDLDE